MFCTVIGCDCQLIIKENYDDDDNVDKQHKHYEHWYSQQHRTQSYNENVADLNLSIFHHFNVRSPRSDPISYWLPYYQIADLTL